MAACLGCGERNIHYLLQNHLLPDELKVMMQAARARLPAEHARLLAKAFAADRATMLRFAKDAITHGWTYAELERAIARYRTQGAASGRPVAPRQRPVAPGAGANPAATDTPGPSGPATTSSVSAALETTQALALRLAGPTVFAADQVDAAYRGPRCVSCAVRPTPPGSQYESTATSPRCSVER